MNERIKELAEQAGFNLIRENCYDTVSTMSVQEFALLIVKECLKQADIIRDNCGPADDDIQQSLGAEWAGRAIARHFGVEQ